MSANIEATSIYKKLDAFEDAVTGLNYGVENFTQQEPAMLDTIAKYEAAKAALLAAYTQPEWMPIGSAPKDGLFLAWNAKEKIWTIWHANMYWSSFERTESPWPMLRQEAGECTHWMPLPTPPLPTDKE